MSVNIIRTAASSYLNSMETAEAAAAAVDLTMINKTAASDFQRLAEEVASSCQQNGVAAAVTVFFETLVVVVHSQCLLQQGRSAKLSLYTRKKRGRRGRGIYRRRSMSKK